MTDPITWARGVLEAVATATSDEHDARLYAVAVNVLPALLDVLAAVRPHARCSLFEDLDYALPVCIAKGYKPCSGCKLRVVEDAALAALAAAQAEAGEVGR